MTRIDLHGDSSSGDATRTARSSTAVGTRYGGLDGMRGLATLAILGYHGELTWTRGSFLAVSQFFTLSGFLITSLLLRKHLVTERNTMRSFWGRRARRLMPAALLALGGVVLFGATVATRQQLDALPGDVISALTWTANWHFVLAGRSYIALFAAPSPVQHFWSLAIEEQFYIFFPLLLLLVLRQTRSMRVLAGVLAAVMLLSSAWMITLYRSGAGLDRIYYGTDTRAAELLAGAVLAVIVMQTGTDFSERLARVLSTLGLAALAVTIWCWVDLSITDRRLWNGGMLGFALLSCAIILGVLANRGPLVAILTFPPLRAVGRISYGLYLYHWPIYLWLDAARTGLSGTALLALRLVVAFAVAIASYRWFEQPILRGARLGGRRARYALVGLVVAVVFAGTVLVSNRAAEDPLAALRAGAASIHMPTGGGDGHFDLLVIPPTADDPIIARLRRSVELRRDVRVTVAPPFACTGGIVATTSGHTCRNWADTWPRLIADHNPDAVLLYSNAWSGESLESLAEPGAQPKDTAIRLLAAALDLLSPKQAPVVWATTPANFGQALQFEQQPFGQAMAQLEVQRGDLDKIVGTRFPDRASTGPKEYIERSAAVMLADASLYQRGAGHDLPRVMIVGNSESISLGYGLNQWAAQTHSAIVWNRGVEGCGIAVDGEIRTFGSSDDSGLERCRAAERNWPNLIDQFQPDVVVVLAGITDVQDRKLPGTDGFSSIGAPAFDRFVVGQYQRAIDTLSRGGARVVWMTAPCVDTSRLSGPADTSAEDLEHLNSGIIAKAVRRRPQRATTFDLARIACPNGRPRSIVDGEPLRPDGVHFSVNGSLWFARRFGEQVLRAGGL